MESVYRLGPVPLGTASRLQDLINAVCPADGVSIGRWDNKETWRLDAQEGASPEEIAAARKVIEEFDPWPALDPAMSGVFDSGSTLVEIREAYEDSHTDNEGAGDVGSVVDSGAVDSGDGGELSETAEDAVSGDPADYSAEPVADDPELAGAGAYPGVMVTGDPLKAAQMELTWQVGDKEDELISQYPADENLARLNELRGIALAIKEGVHPAFDEETAAELQALETFASWLSAVRLNADRLRNAIRQAADMDALGLIDINSGWPE